MILSDGGLLRALDSGTLTVEPIEDGQVQPSSIDLRLGDSFLVMVNHYVECIDPYTTSSLDVTEERIVAEGEYFMLHPGAFVLATTQETVGIPRDASAQVNGKSSLGRIGLLIHSTAGFVDPGFRGQVTLELSNVGILPIKLWPGMRIAQLSLTMLDQPALRPYGSPGLNSKYQGQTGATASRYAQNRKAS